MRRRPLPLAVAFAITINKKVKDSHYLRLKYFSLGQYFLTDSSTLPFQGSLRRKV
ncbi:hypothetical protein YC2023_076334 [Brassica napus]